MEDRGSPDRRGALSRFAPCRLSKMAELPEFARIVRAILRRRLRAIESELRVLCIFTLHGGSVGRRGAARGGFKFTDPDFDPDLADVRSFLDRAEHRYFLYFIQEPPKHIGSDWRMKNNRKSPQQNLYADSASEKKQSKLERGAVEA